MRPTEILRPSAEVGALAAGLRLGLPRALRGSAGGAAPARGTGSSPEFEDRREYRPGDDPRRLDWRALQSRDQALVRLYREELRPRVELLLDVSASTAVEEDKARWTVDLAAILALSARAEGAQVVLTAIAEEPRSLDLEEFLATGVSTVAGAAFAAVLVRASAALRPGALRFLLGDGLVSDPPEEWIAALARGAGAATFVQVLGMGDADPQPAEALRLVDVESGAVRERVLDAAARQAYARRLARHEAEIEDACRRHHVRRLRLVAETPAVGAGVRELVGAEVLRAR